MKSPALYLLEVLFCSGMLLAFYRLLLVRKVSFAACRRWLVLSVLLPVVIPALDIPLYPARTVVYPLPLIAAAPVAEPPEPFDPGQEQIAVITMPAATPVAAPVDWAGAARNAVLALYLLTAAVSLAVFALRMASIRRLRRRSRITDCGDYALAENPQVGTPFSFLRTVFLGEGYTGRRRQIVLCHEASHVRHRHSAERILFELVRGIFWFNPFVWIAGRWLTEVQEWEADRDVLDAGYDLTEYRTVIFRQLFGYNPDIACGLNHSFTKNRFAMMTQFTKRRFAFVRLGAAIPVVAAMMMLCSFTTRTPDPAAPGKTADVHISAAGITYNGHPVSGDELTDYVAAEHGELSEAERAGMHARLLSDGASDSAGAVGKTVTFGSSGSLEVLRADRSYPSDLGTMAFAGNVQARFRDNSSNLPLKAVWSEVSCDSLIIIIADRRFECFDAIFENDDYLSLGAWYRFSVNKVGNWNRHMRNVSETTTDRVIMRVTPDGGIRLNGRNVAVAELEEWLKAWRGDRNPADLGVLFHAGKDVKMGIVTDIKQAMRKAGVLRIFYQGASEHGALRMLPPAPGPDTKAVTDIVTPIPGDASAGNPLSVQDVRIKKRNLFLVLINGSGKILAGTQGRQKIIAPEELTALVEAFVLNASDDPGLSEKRVKEFGLPGGGKMSYPESQGVVSLQTTRDTPYSTYLNVQNRIAKAFEDIRDALARRQFGQPYEDLSDAEQQVVMQAVPLKVSEAEPRR